MMEELHDDNDLKCDVLPSVSDIIVLNIYHTVNNDYIKIDTRHVFFH